MSTIVEIGPGRYVSAIWFIENGNEGDWMGAVWREPGGDWQLRYRFRYYKDSQAWDSDDRKSPYRAHCPDGPGIEAQLIRSVDAAADHLISMGMKGPIHKLVLKTDEPDKIMAALRREKWAHVKEGPDAKEYLKRQGIDPEDYLKKPGGK